MKKSFLTFATLLSVLFAVPAFAVSADGVRFITEEYPPFNMKGLDGVPTGFAVDMLVEMFSRTGTSLSAKDVEILPWARGMREITNNPNTCLFSMTRTAERESLFKWVGPFYTSSFDAIVLKTKGLKAGTVEDLKKLSFGVVRDDMGDKLVMEAGIPSVERVSSHKINLKKLDKGRVDAVVFNLGSLALLLKNDGRPASDIEKYENILTLREGRLYFAFNKETPDDIVESLQKALDDMKSDGTHRRILDSYM